MKKIIPLLLIAPFLSFSANADLEMDIQRLDREINGLKTQVTEKQSRLGACESKIKNRQVATGVIGGVAAVGVAVNVAQAVKGKKLDSDINAAQAKLDSKNKAKESETAKTNSDEASAALIAVRKELEDTKQKLADAKTPQGKLLVEEEVKNAEAKVKEEEAAAAQKGFECPPTSNYPGANGKKLGDKCSYAAGRYFGEERGGVSEGVIYRAASSCYCHARKCADAATPTQGKCVGGGGGDDNWTLSDTAIREDPNDNWNLGNIE